MEYRTTNTKPVAGALNDALTSLEGSTAAQAKDTVAAARSTYESSRALILALLVAGMVAAIALGLFVAHLVIRPVTAVRNGLAAMAAGDLTGRVDVTSTDEVGQMAAALNQASDSLRTTIRGADYEVFRLDRERFEPTALETVVEYFRKRGEAPRDLR